MTDQGKATELKAEPMTTTQLDRWLEGKIPRRILMLPFFGPLKASVFGRAEDGKGRDLDGDYFDTDTDIYGPYPSLRESRQRLVDWHHDQDPTGIMKGAIIGHLQFDERPEDDGYWADYWTNAGEKRTRLVASLERRGTALYGSTQAVPGAVRKAKDGHIEVWPVFMHTISTSPQNPYAVVPPLKAMLDGSSIDELPAEAIKALLVGLDDAQRELLLSSGSASVVEPGDPGVKAGRVLSAQTLAELQAVIDLAEQELPALIRRIVARSSGAIPEGDTIP